MDADSANSVEFERTKVPLMKRIVENAVLTDKRKHFIDEFLKRKDDMPKLVTEVYNDDKIGVERQLEDSDRTVAQLEQNGSDLISNIRLANDRREVQRRVREAELRDVLLSELQKESQMSAAKFEEVTAKWSDISGVQDPMEINDTLESQRASINKLLEEKMNIINQCRDELAAADDRYVKDLDKQDNDISCLVERVDKQMDVMKRTYREHLELLEKTIDDERKILQIVTTKKWETMYEKRGLNEEMRMRREAEKAEFYSSEIARIQLEHEEMIRETKIRLENDNQALEIEIQKLKRNIMLNSEKLDYNFQVLKKREDENVMVRNQQRRRLAKLADTIVSLKKKLKEAKSTCIVETQKFTAEIMKLHGKIIDIERKSDLFAEQNNRKYMTVWDVNFDECEKALGKVLKIDKMLWEQQLDTEWERPAIEIVRKEDLESYKNAMRKIHGPKHESSDESKTVAVVNVEQSVKSREEELMKKKMMKVIFRAVADNSGFLIESKLKELLMPYSRTEQTLVNLDAVFSALGITKNEEIEFMKEYFVQYVKCRKCQKNPFADGYAMDEISIECLGEDHELELTTLDVYKALVKFTKEHTTSLDKMM